jgi:phosphoglucomutase
MDLFDALTEIYEEYGFFQEELLCLDYDGKVGAEKISRIMSHFRENVTKQYSSEPLKLIEDYQSSMTTSVSTNEKTLINLPKSNVLGLFFENGDIIYLRPSGTEPKIKFYLMVNEKDGSIEEKSQKANQKIAAYISTIKETTDNC